MASTTTDNIIILKPREEKRLDDLFNNFSKSEGSNLSLSEFFQLALDRGMLSNRHGYIEFQNLYKQALNQNIPSKEKEAKQQKEGSPLKQQAKGATISKKDDTTEKKRTNINKQQFNFLITQIAKLLYPSEKNKMEKFFGDLLKEKQPGGPKDQNADNPRVMMMDDNNRKLLSEPVMSKIAEYSQELQKIFTIYTSENLAIRKQMLSWKELSLQNKRINAFGVLKFLKEGAIIPDYISIEQIEEILIKTCPPLTPKEHYFYSECKISKQYDSEVMTQESDPKIEGEPRMYYYEFEFFMARVAVDIAQAIGGLDRTPIEQHIEKFFKEKLCIRSNAEIQNHVPLPNLNRKFIQYLQQIYDDEAKDKSAFKDGVQKQKQQKKKALIEEKQQGLQFSSDEEEFETVQQIIKEHASKNKFDQKPIAELDFAAVAIMLENELPELPAPFEVQKQNPPPYKQNKIVIGDPLPKPPPEKNKPKPKAVKKQQLKKGELPPRPIRWDGQPGPQEDSDLELIQKQQDALQFREPLISDFEKASMSHIEVAPCIIREVIYPLDVPPPVRTFIEAGILSHNNHNYAFAIENYGIAQQKWLQWQRVPELSFQQQLFFSFSYGQVYESAGRDDYALERFINCKKINEKYPENAPDRALAYAGMGSSLFNMEEYELSARAYLKARELRENLLGKDAPDTATVYNNLGCCMMMLERNIEAFSYFKLATAILETELGTFHFRTQQAQRNLKKCSKCQQDIIPQYKITWQAYLEEPFAKKGKKKKKKKKK